jgi:RNA polymerase primary sigma factor
MAETAYQSEAKRDSAGLDGAARSYFRKMHSVPLLTKGQEVEVAKRIEEGRREILRAVVESPLFKEALRELMRNLRAAGELRSVRLMAKALKLRGSGREKIPRLLERAGLPEDWAEELAEDHADLVKLAARSEKQRRRVHKQTGKTLRVLRRVDKQIQAALKKYRGAKRDLTEANLRLVVFVAKRFTGMGLSFTDLIQEGNIGLMRAVVKFDYTRKNRFATYAVHWIRQSVVRAIADQSRVIRIPVNKFHSAYKIGRASRLLHQRLGRRPTAEEVAGELGIPVETVLLVREETRRTISLDTPVGDEGSLSLADCIEDEKSPSPSLETEERELNDKTREVLATLSPREERILRLRFGIDVKEEHTLREIGKDFAITRERVRQIESQALNKLRHRSRSRRLKAFTEEG